MATSDGGGAGTTLAEITFRRLRAMILDGTLPSGARVREKDFADRLGVSRTPVREAIGQLVSEGLVTRAGGGMPMVSHISITDVLEILHVRRLLECETARQAAGVQAPVEPLIALRARVLAFLNGPRPGAEEHAALDHDLHVALARRAGSQMMTEMIEALKTRTRIFDQGSIPDRYEPGCHEHVAILDAVLDGDPALASDRMRDHLQNVRDSIIEHIRRPF